MSEGQHIESRREDQGISETQDIIVGRPGLRAVAGNLDHPEAVCWDPVRSAVLAGGEAGQLYSFGLDGEAMTELASFDNASLLGLAIDGSGRVYACDCARGLVLRLGIGGSVDVVASDVDYPNYLVFDPDGNLWISASGSWESSTGRIHRVATDGVRTATERSVAFPNGLAIFGGYLYIVESALARIVRMPLGGHELEEVVALPRTVPDGIAFDEEGGLWISCFQPNRIYRMDRSGGLETVVDDWSGEVILTPTNIAFSGSDLRTLVIASIGGRAVKALRPGIAGARLEYPRGPDGGFGHVPS
jgi:gluconolactonase